MSFHNYLNQLSLQYLRITYIHLPALVQIPGRNWQFKNVAVIMYSTPNVVQLPNDGTITCIW